METEVKFPQVILLGNGINRAFGGMSWSGLLQEMAAADKKNVDIYKLKSPAPFQVIYLTNDTVNETLKRHKYQLFGKVSEEGGQAEILKQILSMGADQILTTNYSYELEYAAYPHLQDLSDKAKENKLKTLRHCENEKLSGNKYMLYEYNQVQYGSQVNKIWHIHGEARKHSSMIFGHFYYGMVLQDIIKYVKDKKNDYAVDQKNGRESAIKSWIDAFILGDIYLIGTRLELSEIDLWWLINRKKREKNASHGNIYFYEPKFEPEEEGFVDERLELIKVFAREVKDMGITIPKIDKDDPLAEEKRGEKFREFYRKAVNDISEKIAAKKS